MAFFERISKGLSRSRNKFKEQMNVLLDRGPRLDEEFWELLEETLILSDVGAYAADTIVENLRDQATRQALPDAYAVLDLLNDNIAKTFTEAKDDIFNENEVVLLFVGINGTGKTTTVGKIAKEYSDSGRNVILGSADTFRAAAIEQLEVWANRAGVEMVTRERGSDPASVCYDTIERAEQIDANLVLIDTAGRLHTSADLMRELEKVVNVVRKRSQMPVYTILVIDATTGQNGLQQAREFNKALDIDGLIITKLDGTAKGGIALAISHELELPIYKIGVGEGIDDLRDFDAHDFASALIGDFDERYDEDEPEYEDATDKGSSIEEEVSFTNESSLDKDLSCEDEASLGEDLSFENEISFKDESLLDFSGDENNDHDKPFESEESDETTEVRQTVGIDDEKTDTTEFEAGEGESSAESQTDTGEDLGEATQEDQPKKKKHFWERWF